MGFKKLRAPSLTDMFVSEIKRMILEGELAIGQKLPPERQLAEEMDVSPAVIHAGTTRLAALGFLNIVPRQGTFVADYIRYGNINTMMEILDDAGHSIDHRVLDPISALRRSIELGASKLACTNRTGENLRVMEEQLTLIAGRAEHSRVPDHAFRFHHEVAVASGNIYYPMIVMTFQSVYRIFFKLSLAEESSRPRIAMQFRELYEAIRDRDPDTAERAVNGAIDAWLEHFELSDKIDRESR